MNSAQLRTQIQIQAETVTRNEFGEQITSWNTIHTVMSKKRAVSGLKNEIGESITTTSKVEFYIRYIGGLSTKMRIVEPQRFHGVDYPSLVYRIENIEDSSGGKRMEQKITCKTFE